jgi:hypothetical protein
MAGLVGNTRRLYTRDSRAFCAAEIEDLSGVVEVTVWPELYERTQELWLEGNILLLQVRARDRNGRLQIAVQQVELYQLADGTPAGFVPPPWAAAEGMREAGKWIMRRRRRPLRSTRLRQALTCPATAAP